MTRRQVALAVLIGWTGAFLMATVLLADPSVVKTSDGNTYRGDVSERNGNLIVTNRGVETVIPKADVASIQPIGDWEQAFQAKLAKLDPKDIAGRIALARQAFEQRRYDLARDTLEDALTIDPANKDASNLLDLVQSQIRMERNRSGPNTAPPPGPRTGPPLMPGQPGIEKRLLTSADIDAIRREELKSTDNDVRIRFVGDVKRRFADSQNTPLADFLSLSPVEQAIQILSLGDASMRDNVRVLSDPQSIIEYRRQIQPLVLQGCATASCHGGPAAGGLILLTATENDSVTYTNFYILQKYTKRVETGSNGVFSGYVERRLIDRGHGEQSLLANYGLPALMAGYDHPPVNGRPLTPIFRNKEDARYQTVVDWMNDSLNPGNPDYGIHFTPPTPVAPATNPVPRNMP